jgi:chloramphenicol 3-O-phosphotransferase
MQLPEISIEYWGGQILANPIIILISGKIGAGKTTLAQYLLESFKEKDFNHIKITSFARAVKSIASTCFFWDGQKDERGRKLLQDIGRAGRNYDKDIWANILIEDIYRDDGTYFPDAIIIDDWRFPNEFNRIIEAFKVNVIKVRVIRSKGSVDNNDISETSLTDDMSLTYDVSVFNKGSLEDLKSYAKEIVEYILKGEI